MRQKSNLGLDGQRENSLAAEARSKCAFKQKNILYFFVNRGDKLPGFYTNVAFENIGFRPFFRAFSFA